MKTIEDAAREIGYLNMIRENEALIEQLQAYEGRIPHNHELSTLAGHFVFRDGSEEFRWRGKTIMKIMPLRKVGLCGFGLREIVKIPA